MDKTSPGKCERKTLNQAFAAELDCLRPKHGLYGGSPAAGTEGKLPSTPPCYCDAEEDRAKDLKRIYAAIGDWSAARRKATEASKTGRTSAPIAAGTPDPLTALCLSGGGIRSATFNLGVLQALAQVKMLGKFDYLSSVSGGGYVATWLRAWMHRAGVETVVEDLGRDPKGFTPLHPEATPVANLRDYSNYLTPVVGLFSGDTWSAAATILRNLLLNWIMLLPALGAVIGIPLLFLLFIRTNDFTLEFPNQLLTAALALEGVASLLVYLMRRFAKSELFRQYHFILACVLPICLAAGALSVAALGFHLPGTDLPSPAVRWSSIWRFCAIWCLGVPFVGWFLAEMIEQFVNQAKKWAAGSFRSATAPSEAELEENVRSVSLLIELMALTVSGLIGMCLLVAVIESCYPFLFSHPALYTVFVLPMLLGVYLISRVIFVGVASYSDELGQRTKIVEQDHSGTQVRNRIYGNDADREWWSRLSGWLLLVILGWTLVTGVCLLGCYLPDFVANLVQWIANVVGPNQHPVAASAMAHGAATAEVDPWSSAAATVFKWAIAAVGGASGLIAALRGNDPDTPAQGSARPGQHIESPARILGVAGLLFLVCLIMIVSWMVKGIAQSIVVATPLFDRLRPLSDPTQPLELQFSVPGYNQPLPWEITLTFFGLLLGFALLALMASRFVNVNRFSLHGMYRNRLVRAYLGASNCRADGHECRIPDPFTGFALTDNFPLHCLCDAPIAPPQAGTAPDSTVGSHCTCAGSEQSNWSAPRKPLSIINTTLNLVNGEKLAWQQRKAASFSMTPLFCGNWMEGYRSSRKYGGPDGITVGTAMTISGAAANPNMGYCSSPVLGFLMAMFNLRLGAWLGNTNVRGNDTYSHPGPRHALLCLFAEMLGLTNSHSKYVNLSDGGHFDNLGLYEAVLRRCRYILVSDAGRDENFTFEDLGNSIRKIRIDFGIDIQFKTIQILPNSDTAQGLSCALGHIRYSLADGTDEKDDGLLLYIKPTLRGEVQVPYDIYSYSKSCRDFPHESTINQWFSESQFESYRALGFHLGHLLTERLTTRLRAQSPQSEANQLPAATLFEEFFAVVEEYTAGTDACRKDVASADVRFSPPLKTALRAPGKCEVLLSGGES
jgi:hypothetical protein